MSLPRPLLVGLIVSAALNVFLIGGVAGVTYVRLSSPPPVAPPPPALAAAPAYAPPVWQAPPPAADPATPSRATPAVRPAQSPAQAPAQFPAPPPQDGERLARPPLWTAGDQLSPQSRKALRLALRAANQKNQPITRQARTERQAALAALTNPSFDPAEVGKRLTNARTLDIQARANVEAALAAYAATLSPSERAVLAQGLTRIYAPRQALRQNARQGAE
ncbi:MULTISPECIES: periplasmic heavy metal sensor [unclassified Caulobacter]|uniref:periplasmic heavy metal sensor n=1 Tax=unclassified Caulobacter TaxID=2648921 RepID=UPI0006F7151D|nr:MULTISPECIES: periplasmic heavy metal sensor [unclassified Caulobacter]KQV56164.1 hypothetical protein ASC62_19930 [Caulobacter sp. Root342]KQV70660.1 hypothetical protein ASC70_03325 [Caulobacter sp. Root343]